MLEEHFVCFELDATAHGIPASERYPALAPIRTLWDANPWTRMGFGIQYVFEPEGRFMLSAGAKRPYREANEASTFVAALEESLRNFERIRSHRRGSAAEAAEIERVRTEVDVALRDHVKTPYMRTQEIFQTANYVEQRFPAAIDHADPQVRQQVIELIGEYAEKEGDPGFCPGGRWEVFAERVAGRLDDEDEAVRAAAARAVLRFGGAPVPDASPDPTTDELVAAARALWSTFPDQPSQCQPSQ